MKYKMTNLLLLSFIGMYPFVAFNQTTAVETPEIKIHKHILDNGLKVLLYENHRLPIFYYYTFFDVGGRFEGKGYTGSSHFLEHLMFKGAKKYGPGKFDQLIESNGGDNNAYTTFDLTVYHENLPIHALDLIIDVEADRMVNLKVDSVAFEKERQVVLEERKMRYENSPMGKLYLTMMKEMFKGTPYGGSVIGEMEDISTVKRDSVYEYFKNFYAPNNAVLMVAGDIDPAKTLKSIKEKYGDIKANPKIQELKKTLDDKELYKFKGDYNRDVILELDVPNTFFMFAFKGHPYGDQKDMTLDFLSSSLNGGKTGYLNNRYVYGDKRVLNSISAQNYSLRNNGVFYFSGELAQGVDLVVFKEQFKKDIKSFCSEGVTESNLEKNKNLYFMSYFQKLGTSGGVVDVIGDAEVSFGDYKRYLDSNVLLNNLKIDQLKKLCEETLHLEDSIFFAVTPKNKNK